MPAKASNFFMPIYLLALMTLGWSISMSQQRPNVIYIYADDLGYGELGCYGQKKIKTPHLDRLASEGVRFTQHYTSSPVCAPARCMLLTGMHGGHSYIRGNYELGGFADSEEGGQMLLHDGAFTIGKLMKLAGYTTACIGKWGLGMAGGPGDPNRQGFDQFYGYLDQKQAHNHYPTHSPGRVSHHVSAQYDLMATLADLVGLPPPSSDGISFLPELKGHGQIHHQYLYFEFPEKQGQVAIRLGKWKAVKSNMKKDPSSPWEVYDLEVDPGETTDLSASNPNLVAKLHEILKNEHTCSHLREWEFVDPKFQQR
jgi:arylsulfatase A-like enzyme